MYLKLHALCIQSVISSVGISDTTCLEVSQLQTKQHTKFYEQSEITQEISISSHKSHIVISEPMHFISELFDVTFVQLNRTKNI